MYLREIPLTSYRIGTPTSFAKLGLASSSHSTLVAMLDGTNFTGNLGLDQENLIVVKTLAVVAGKSFVPSAERDSIVGAFTSVRDRLTIAQRTVKSDKAPYAETVQAIDAALTLIKKQPQQMAAPGNSHVAPAIAAAKTSAGTAATKSS